MDPAEEIVSLWLQQEGFFIKYGVDAGYRGKQLDFLALDPFKGRRVHVEVHVAVKPLGPLRPWGPARYGRLPFEVRVRGYYNDKFIGATVEGKAELLNRCVEEKAREMLGEGYEKWLVLGALHREDSEERLREEFGKLGVRIISFRDILKEIRFKGTARNPTGRLLQLIASQLTEEAKNNLLKG